MLRISFDRAKSDGNLRARGISFDAVDDFDWGSALVIEDLRKDYGERRFQAIGLIGDRLHVLVFTPRKELVHVISLRKANRREVRRYEAQNPTDPHDTRQSGVDGRDI